ncbi:MAG: ferritin family protein [Betaproteobacteria bacterium]|nr:ferritin family protein [Betaproteobacteria bacterium]
MSAKKTARKKKPISVPAKVTRKRAARRAQGRSAPFADFMVQAYVMESEARDRYTEFADQMEVHNNVAVAQLFRRLSRIEGLHAQKIMKEMGWRTPPAPTLGWIWGHADAPESVPVTELHYLMQPYHALELALQCEQRAESFFSGIARSIAPGDVKRIAIEMAKEERQHVRLIKDWLKKVEKPAPGWDRDPDPPYLSE